MARWCVFGAHCNGFLRLDSKTAAFTPPGNLTVRDPATGLPHPTVTMDGCSASGRPEKKNIDPNAYPTTYKADLLAEM
jgi:hypothetical protein